MNHILALFDLLGILVAIGAGTYTGLWLIQMWRLRQ